MTKWSRSAEPWPTSYFVMVGAVFGIFLATLYHMLHNHSQLEPGEVLQHFVPQLVVGLLVGSIVFGGASAIRNRLKQRP